MDHVGGSSHISGADRMQPWDHQPQNVVGVAAAFDPQFMMLRQDTREKISEYLGRRPMLANCREKLPDLVMQLEEVLFRRYPNKSDYHNMTTEPTETHILFAVKTLHSQRQQVQRNQQSSRQIASSCGYGTTTPTHGITQGASEIFRMSYAPCNMGPSFGGGLVPQSANMGTSLSEAHVEHVNTELSLGIYPAHRCSRVSNNNPVINMGDTSETNLTLSMATPTPPKETKFSCPVCLQDMVDTASTICGHVFCHECIRASIKAQKKCPTCRRKLTMRNFHRVHLPTMTD